MKAMVMVPGPSLVRPPVPVMLPVKLSKPAELLPAVEVTFTSTVSLNSMVAVISVWLVPVPLEVMVAGPLPAASKMSDAASEIDAPLRIVLLELESFVKFSEPTVKLQTLAGQVAPVPPSETVRVPVGLGKMAAAPTALGTVPSVHCVESPQKALPVVGIQFSASDCLPFSRSAATIANAKGKGPLSATSHDPPEECRINRSSTVETRCS